MARAVRRNRRHADAVGGVERAVVGHRDSHWTEESSRDQHTLGAVGVRSKHREQSLPDVRDPSARVEPLCFDQCTAAHLRRPRFRQSLTNDRRNLQERFINELLRYRTVDAVELGVLKSGHEHRIIPLAAISADYPTMRSIIEGGDAALFAGQNRWPTLAKARSIWRDVRLLAPIERPGKYMAIGMNYAQHIEEAKRLGQPTPTQQFWFNKQTSCLSGPFDEIEPGVAEQLDYEVELGVVIGRSAKGVSEDDAKSHVFGLCRRKRRFRARLAAPLADFHHGKGLSIRMGLSGRGS